jgi:putative acetyltransferase
MTVRPETPADHATIHEINARAFGRDDEARLVDALRASEHFITDLSLVAEADGPVIGHILFTRIQIRTAADLVPALALAPLAVHPDWQRRGIGSRLVREGLDACRRLSHRIVIVVGHPTYYPRFGFTSARTFGLQSPYHDAAFMAHELVPGALRDVQGTVEYPPVFDGV